MDMQLFAHVSSTPQVISHTGSRCRAKSIPNTAMQIARQNNLPLSLDAIRHAIASSGPSGAVSAIRNE